MLDMEMPEMDGETLGQEIKHDPLLQDTILVMLTSIGKRGDAARLRDIGFSAYLNKPVKRSMLYDCLTTVSGYKSMVAKAPLVTSHTLLEEKKRKRILLAEDNIVNQKVAKLVLEKLGYYVDVVGNGLEAVQAVGEVSYDLVLMDIQMPEMDGFEATAAIRKKEKGSGKHIPIIALTAHAMQGDRERCLASNMDGYVSKPIYPQEVDAAIRELLTPPDNKIEVVSSKAAGRSPVFDQEALLGRLGGEEEIAADILKTFLETVPGQLDDLNLALGNKDVKRIERIAHTIKGGAASISAIAFKDVAFEIEQAGKKGEMDSIPPLLLLLQQEYNKLVEELTRYLTYLTEYSF
jgi:two-component system, sensor histidine kinase and response regulator